MAQVVAHILGKDEVTSSNLVISSTKKTIFVGGQIWSFSDGLQENGAYGMKVFLNFLEGIYNCEVAIKDSLRRQETV